MWTKQIIDRFHAGSTSYIKNQFVDRGVKVDCADLALEYLLDFCRGEGLPIRLRYYSGGWKTHVVGPAVSDFEAAKREVKRDFGALNVIDNTFPIDLSQAKPGDLIMSKWSGTQGHTRIIVSVGSGSAPHNRAVTFYQGNLPPVVPIKKTQAFGAIDFGKLTDKRPRRWIFAKLQ
ncbi:MAG: hypothetical protein KUG77_00770 [Nannocystaceae bacterium]|nr:hypothetical protein [Nannocystaceae bacterium]